MNYHARYINLDHRKDRDEHMKMELGRLGLDQVKRHPAIHYKNVDFMADRYRTMRERTPGAIGCYLSQMEVLLEAGHRKVHAVVMEDDLVFCSDFKERMKLIEYFMEHYPWDVIWLGGTYHRDTPYWHKNLGADYEDIGEDHFVRTFGAFSTHAYIVNKDSIFKIIGMLNEEMATSIGIDFSFIRMQPKLNTFAFVPGCVKQIDNQSDIGTGITHFSRFNKLGSHWWADKMSDYIEIKHRSELVGLLKKFGISGPVVEIGVAEGLFSKDLLDAGIDFLHMVDNWATIPGIRGDGNFPQEWHDANYKKAYDNVYHHANFEMMKMLSQQASVLFQDGSLAMVYHDADHSYKGVRADIVAWWNKVKPGGIMAFHDYFMPEYGVRKAVEEMFPNAQYNFILEKELKDSGCWIRKPL